VTRQSNISDHLSLPLQFALVNPIGLTVPRQHKQLITAMRRLSHGLLAAFVLVATTALAEELKFSITPDFFEANPGGQPLGPCHGGAVIDKAGNIYITTDTPRGILVFSPEGKFVRAFGPTHIHGLQLREENGVEYIYGARPDYHDVLKLTLDGAIEWTIHYPPEAGIYKDEKGFKPCAVTVGPDGSIYVADGYGSNFLLKFDKDRKFVKAVGGPGAEEGKFNTCHGIGLDTRVDPPLLLVCNRNNNRVEYWDLDCNFVRVIQKDLRMPCAVNIRGDYAVLPELEGRVTVLNRAGEIVARVGDNPIVAQRKNYALPPDQWKIGICNSPHGAAIDKDGNLIVTEWSQFGHLHKFSRDSTR
jgi:DNA-binding beta-propeller fold protein YncE